MAEREERLGRDAFRLFRPISTRWMDNDVYAHVNNVVYYSFFDTAVTAHLVEAGLLVPGESTTTGLTVESACQYFESVAFPETVETGLAVAKLGRSSVTYRIGVFRQGGVLAAAQGRFTHVYVERASGRPVPIPDANRAAFERLT